MSTVRVEVDKGLQDILLRVTKPSTLRRVARRLMHEAEEMAEHARENWPVGRDNTGKPSIRKSRRYHSRDRFFTRARLLTTAIEVVLHNDAEWAYKIKSVQVTESDAQSQRRFFWPNGETPDDHWARVQAGKKRNAWNYLVIRRERSRRRVLIAEMGDEIMRLAEGR